MTPVPRERGRWQTLFAVDFDARACDTYRANLPGVDVRCAAVADVLDAIPDVDVICGGPPCQPHSFAGKRKASKDSRDGGPDFVAAIARVRPRMFLMENVAGLMTSEGGVYAQRLLASMEAAGYVVAIRVLDAVNFGVPQFRNRCWWWGIRTDLYANGLRPRWPLPTHAWPAPLPSMFGETLAAGVTVGQATGLHGVIRVRRSDNHAGERRLNTTDETSPTVQAKPVGGWDRLQFVAVYAGGANPHFIGDDRHFLNVIDRPSPTLTRADHFGNQMPVVVESDDAPTDRITMPYGVSPRQHWKSIKGRARKLTPWECGRLQSVPDSFIWPEGATPAVMYRVIGNGWACEMARVMAGALAAADPDSRTVADLFCGGGLGAVGWHGRSWRYEPQSKSEVLSA